MGKTINTILCEGIQVALKIEAITKNKATSYYPQSILLSVEEGELSFEMNKKQQIISANQFLLLKKYTTGHLRNSADMDGKTIVKMFMLQDHHIRNLSELSANPGQRNRSGEKFIFFDENPELTAFFKNLDRLFSANAEISNQSCEQLTRQLIEHLNRLHPDNGNIVAEFANDELPDLGNFMRHNFHLKVNLDELARMTGRSLSTFNREFKKIFHETPHKWILKKRLEKAKILLTEEGMTSSQIYHDLGFADLAHFSRSFKKEFGVPPSEI